MKRASIETNARVMMMAAILLVGSGATVARAQDAPPGDAPAETSADAPAEPPVVTGETGSADAVAPAGEVAPTADDGAAEVAPSADDGAPSAATEPATTETSEASETSETSASDGVDVEVIDAAWGDAPPEAPAAEAPAAEVSTVAQEQEPAAEAPPSPLAGSRVTYRNAVAARSFDPASAQHYDPLYVMSLRISPSWSFNDHVSVGGDLYFGGELTTSNSTTSRIYFLVDSEISVTGTYTIPVVEIDLEGSFGVSFPTTEASQGASKYLGLSIALNASYTLPLLEGLTFALEGGFSKDFHAFTTASSAGELLTGARNPADIACRLERSASCAGMESYRLGGEGRNVEWGMYGRIVASLAATDWLSAAVSFASFEDHLYGLTVDPRVSNSVENPVDVQWAFLWTAGVKVTPIDLLSIGFGGRGFAPQLSPAGRFYTPIFNPYAQLYVDVILNADKLFNL